MTAKTPEQTARESIGVDALAGIGYDRDLAIAIRAIETDRAERTLLTLLADELVARATQVGDAGDIAMAERTAQCIRNADDVDELKSTFLVPLLDELEVHYGAAPSYAHTARLLDIVRDTRPHSLTLDVDAGKITVPLDEALEAWEQLAPGEPFEIVALHFKG